MHGTTPQRYDAISRTFHWVMAFLIAWQLLKVFDRIDEGEHWIGQTLVPAHVSIGILLLVLVALRIAWAVKQKDRRPAPVPPMAGAGRAGHFLLYVALVLQPITGILYMIGNGHGLNAFGIDLVAEGEEVAWMASLGSLHSPIAWTLLVLIVGHIGMALYHQFIRKDGLLRRML